MKGSRSRGPSRDVLEYLDPTADARSTTLETGGGASTVLFALKGARHTCIVPYADEIERIKKYCAKRQISTAAVTFIADTSEQALPGLEQRSLDLVLIDGRHGFPAPFIDWFYTSRHLT